MEADITLMELLEGLHDPRTARGKRHSLPALLSLAVVAMLAGMTTYEAIVDYGKERGWEFLQLLGFTRRRGLCKATYSRIFRRIDAAAFEAAVSRWICGRLKPGDTPHLAIDGKTLRGSRDGETPVVHLLSAYAPDIEAVVAQMRVDAKTNELKAALEMLAILPIKGRLITADAIQTHRAICAAVIEGGGDYILPVKDNQPTLRADIEAAFAEPEAGLSRRVAGEHCCSPAPSERHVNLSVYAAQASLKVPRGTRSGAGAPPARYWSGADERYTPETAPAGKLPSSALPPKPVAQTVSCGDTRGKSARFRGG